MPYIDAEERPKYDAIIAQLPPIETTGHLNYILSRIVLRYLDQYHTSYSMMNAVVGALECVKLEFYRRLVGPYESIKAVQNGDIYP